MENIEKYARQIYGSEYYSGLTEVLEELIPFNYKETAKEEKIKLIKYLKDSFDIEPSDLVDGIRGAMWRVYINSSFYRA